MPRHQDEIHGTVEPGFEACRIEFEANFRRGLEAKAQCCVYYKGKKVVDLWGVSAAAKSRRKEGEPEYGPESLQILHR